MSNRILLAMLLALTLTADALADEGVRFELRHGERFFRADGRPVFILGRNPAGMTPKDYDEHFRHAAAAGERFVRIHFTFFHPKEKPGEIDAGMLTVWDSILDSAEKHQLGVLPVFGVWAEWNDGSRKETWHNWDKNPYNATRGGPAQRPAELFEDTACRKLWLQRLETFVKHWAQRHAIIGWEIFSELNLVTGATEEGAVRFVEAAAAVMRAADPWKRPLTASQAGFKAWPKLQQSDALDFIQVHPYADGRFGGRLDELILKTTREFLQRFGKPVLIGESGLNSGPPHNTLEVAPRATIGIRHAIWAATVSGAMNGRALWWQDGYDRFEKADLCNRYHDIAASAAIFVRGMDYSGFTPVSCAPSSGLKGAMLGNERNRIGWFRDAACEPPGWPVRPMQEECVTVPATGTDWQVEFFDPITGQYHDIRQLTVQEQKLRIILPVFQDAIAFRIKQLPPPDSADKTGAKN